MNFVLGFLVLLILVGVRGKEVPVIAKFTDQSPAFTAGLEIGDRILKLDDKKSKHGRMFLII